MHIVIITHGKIHLDGNYFPYIRLGNTSGIMRMYLPNALDDTSEAISISPGFPFGVTSQSLVYVSQ